MSEKWMHEYFNHKSSKWTIMSFLDECKAKSFPDKIGQYLTSLEAITKNESGKRSEKALHFTPYHPIFKNSSLGIRTVNGGIFNIGLSSKQGQENKESNGSVKKVYQTTARNKDIDENDSDDLFISNNRAEGFNFRKTYHHHQVHNLWRLQGLAEEFRLKLQKEVDTVNMSRKFKEYQRQLIADIRQKKTKLT
ncbi:hypothetical protein RhiirB3_443282 [Rhizophagus irregularis]|nr:hypothetical protein RhiirB3_443282 [Rhizophagus irregularis]